MGNGAENLLLCFLCHDSLRWNFIAVFFVNAVLRHIKVIITMNAKASMLEAAKAAGYVNMDIPEIGHKKHNNTALTSLAGDELYAAATKIQTKLVKQTGHIRACKPHVKPRAELIAACKETLEDLRVIAHEISPRNPHGYTDPRPNGELFSEDCIVGWRNEIQLLIDHPDGITPF